jgi:hypothetical protein
MKLKDEIMDKLIDEMTRDNGNKAPNLKGANGFNIPFTKENWIKIEKQTIDSVKNYLKKSSKK